MNPTLFFGTNNVHKLQEIQAILGEKFEVLSFKDFPPLEVAETEPTLVGNAVLKAKAFYAHTQIPCFADDTGLEVEALGGAPGVFSARYAGEACKPADNIRKLLHELHDSDNRKARFLTVIAFFDGEQLHCFEGEVRGEIITEVKGEGGFGYDPVFVPEGYTQTFAEMPAETKHAISHRGKALRKFTNFLLGVGA